MAVAVERWSTIFAVIDPSRFIQTAYRRAEAIARHNNARVIAWCCISDDDSHEDSAQARLDTVRDAISRLRGPDSDVDVEVRVQVSSDWRQALVEAASLSGADLVVKIASRHSRVSRMFRETSDWMLLSDAVQPVLLVADRAPREERRLLAAVKLRADAKDCEQLNQQVIALSHYLSDAAGFEMHVASAFRGEEVYYDRQRFADACGLPRNRVHSVEGPPWTAIAKAADEIQADTIVIGNPDNSETAQRLIDHANADMLILPPT